MTDKNPLLVLIEQKGNCMAPIRIECERCPLFQSGCMLYYDSGNARYHRAIELYAMMYNKEDIVAILL